MSQKIILYGYPEAPNFQKVSNTLALLKIPHSVCITPKMLPRPDFAEVDITYRRIPLLSIGNQTYVDTSLIVRKLAEIAKVPIAPSYEAFGNIVFPLGVGLIPSSNPIMSNEAFIKDRFDLIGPGREINAEALKKNRPTVLSQFQSILHTIQTHLLSDNKKFFLGGDKPTIADIQVYYIINFVLNGHRGAEPEVTRETYPAVFEWVDNVRSHLSKEKVPSITWEEAKKEIMNASADASNVKHDIKNPLKLNSGEDVLVVPTDTGRNHPQKGKLIGLNDEEVCLQNKSGVVLHFPRVGYFVSKL
jgi:glutathione S-transferase